MLRDINLTIPRGQTLAIIGESGCGKTVLLKTIIGLVHPTKGQVLFDGQDLAQLTEPQLTHERTRFGFVFQGAALFDSMTIGQNVGFPLREHTGKSNAEIRDIVLQRLAEVGLPESIVRKKPAELSGGMRKRVGLARALALNPELMLYDEPTTGLDPIMSDVINELILRTRSQHPVTSIVVTHDMRTARKVADRVMMLYPLSRLRRDEPQIIFDGPPDQIDRASDPRVTQFVTRRGGRAADGDAENGGATCLRQTKQHILVAADRASRAEASEFSMDERVIKFRVGVMVLATLFIAGILMLAVRRYAGRWCATCIPIYMHFDDAPGVTEGTPVRKSGILIGRVRTVRFAEQGGVIVEAEIYRNVHALSQRSAAGQRFAAGGRRRDPVRPPLARRAQRAGHAASAPGQCSKAGSADHVDRRRRPAAGRSAGRPRPRPGSAARRLYRGRGGPQRLPSDQQHAGRPERGDQGPLQRRQ